MIDADVPNHDDDGGGSGGPARCLTAVKKKATKKQVWTRLVTSASKTVIDESRKHPKIRLRALLGSHATHSLQGSY